MGGSLLLYPVQGWAHTARASANFATSAVPLFSVPATTTLVPDTAMALAEAILQDPGEDKYI
jgi:hypothetical protein